MAAEAEYSDILNDLINRGMLKYLAMAVAEKKLKEKAAWEENSREKRAIFLYQNPETIWPQLDVVWDLSRENFYLADDHVEKPHNLAEAVKLVVVGVEIENLYSNMKSGSQPASDGILEDRSFSTARLIAHLERGGIVTPPLMGYANSKPFLVDGNHRFRWARHRQQGRMPILINLDDRSNLQAVLTSMSSWF